MPEIAEVARIVHFLKLKLIGKRIATASAIDDNNVFGKVGTSGAEVEAALKGRMVVSAGSQGKYFWITLDKPPHLVMHFGMTGWVHIRGEQTAYTNYYKKMKQDEMDQWPPKFWKFHFTTEGKPGDQVQVAFTDARRFGRVRLVHCPGADIRKHSPLVENGPDPVQDLDVFTESYLRTRMRARHVPLKALLLDQTTISGIGNWVADETLFHARLHPEQYCDEFSDEEIAKLFRSVRHVCQTAVDKLGDSDAFPEDWLFNYRWGKGDKSAPTKLPSGEKLAFITVGGRTSCYAPGLQKKTGGVVPGAKAELVEDVKSETKGKKKEKDAKADSVAKTEGKQKASAKRRKVKEEDVDEKLVYGETEPKQKRAKKEKAEEKVLKVEAADDKVDGRRRSGRLRR